MFRRRQRRPSGPPLSDFTQQQASGILPINNPVPRLWERFGLKTPLGLSGMRNTVQPVTITEPNTTEVNALRFQNPEGTAWFSGTATNPATSASVLFSVKAVPGLYAFQFNYGSGTTGIAGTCQWQIVDLTTGTTIYTFIRQALDEGWTPDLIAYIPYTFDVRWVNGALIAAGVVVFNCTLRKIQGGDTLDVGYQFSPLKAIGQMEGGV